MVSLHNLADVDRKVGEARKASRFLVELSHRELPSRFLSTGMFSSDAIQPALEATSEEEVIFVNREDPTLLHHAVIKPLRQGDGHPPALLLGLVDNLAPTFKPVEDRSLPLSRGPDICAN